MSDELSITPDVKITTGYTTSFVIHGRQQYARVEITDGALPGETFDDMSARVCALAITHLSGSIDELAAQLKEKK